MPGRVTAPAVFFRSRDQSSSAFPEDLTKGCKEEAEWAFFPNAAGMHQPFELLLEFYFVRKRLLD